MSQTRDCDCDHGFPLCCCALGYTGETLLYESRIASSIAGWPTRQYDEAAVAEHNARMEAARAAAEQEQQQDPPAPVMARADKPRIPLGTRLGGPDCGPCQEAKA